ncbi:AsmA-like C-terminal region-containing protein [Roseibium sp.]|uniref:AsmA-like C-terminal region-containing protein n=1 Tax=Roseibium sp. TaxID=1936156 RepID=UPI003D110BF6
MPDTENSVGALKDLGRKRPTARRVLISLAFAGAGLVGFVLLALYSGVLLPLRQLYAEHILQSIVDRKVKVGGPVAITLSDTIRVSIRDAQIANDSQEAYSRLFQEVTLDVSYGVLLAGEADIHSFGMYGATVDVSPVSAEAGPEEFSENRWDLAKIPSEILKNPISNNLVLSDVLVMYRDKANGWDESITIDTLRFERQPGAKDIKVSLVAEANGYPISVDGQIFDDPANALLKTFASSVVMPSLKAEFDGRIDISKDIASMEARLSAGSPAVHDLLGAFGYETSLEAEGEVQVELKGALDRLSAENLSASLETKLGDRYTLAGRVGNLALASGIDTRFAGSLAPPETPSKGSDAVVVLTGFSGKLVGDWSSLRVRETHVYSNIAALDLEELGPISIGRIVKRPDDRIALEDIRILDGPIPQQSPIVLTGRVEDALAASGVRIDGTFRFPTSHLLELDVPEIAALGAVAGTVALSDEDGLLGLTQLEGGIEGSDLISAAFSLNVPALRLIDRFQFETEIGIPDLVAYGTAIGAEISGATTSLVFKGKAELVSNGMSMDGLLHLGSSDVELAATFQDVEDAEKAKHTKFHASGSLSSVRFSLSEFDPLLDILAYSGPPDLKNIEIDRSDFDNLIVDVSVDISELDVDGKKAGDLQGDIHLEDRILSLKDFSLRFLSGAVKGNFSFNLSSDAPSLSAQGRIEKFNLARLLKELGITSPVTSTVYSSFDINAGTTSSAGFLKTMSGRVTTSLWGGNIPTEMIDLAGLNLVSWLFPPEDKQSGKFVCAVLPFSFKNGVASGKAIIIETGNVQLIGEGSVDFRDETLDLKFAPRPKRRQAVDVISPFEVKGQLGKPEVVPIHAAAGRALGEIISLPFNLTSRIFGGAKLIDEKAKPCVLPKTAGAK